MVSKNTRYERYELISWFDLSNYELGDTPLVEWGGLFKSRASILSMLEIMPDAIELHGHSNITFRDHFKVLYSDHFYDTFIVQAKLDGYIWVDNLERHSGFGESTVIPMSAYDYYLQNNKLNKLIDHADEIDLSRFIHNQKAVFEDSNLKINLSASDRQIKSDFEKWLKGRRANLAQVQKHVDISGRKIKEWNQFRVLAYFDLLVWQKLTGIKISDAEIDRILFPDDEKETVVCSSSRVGKTLKTYKKTILDNDLASVIAAQCLKNGESISKKV